jgi:hypothetical protein
MLLEKSIEAIESAYTGMVGDGKIFVSDIQETYRIRTKKRELTLSANSLYKLITKKNILWIRMLY